MFSKIGLGGILTFNSGAADAALKRTAGLFGNLRKNANRAASGVRSIGAAVGGASLALLPLTAALAVGAGQAASFEHQMKAVQAVTGASGEELTRLTNKAKVMGATTAFSATEAGKGMEYLARAGANTDQIIAAIGGTMNAAAADGMSLADATNVVAQVVKGMGLEFSEATRVADVLAKTSARSNTNIQQLGFGFQYAAAQGRTMGFSLETVAAVLGKVADAGLQGSVGGTSFTNMLVKLAKPSKEAGVFMEKFKIALTTTKGEMVPFPRIIEQFSKALGTIKDPVKQARMMTELFGVRGQKAFAALRAAGPAALADLIRELEAAKGAAEKMAQTRLDSFIGQATILKSSLEGVAIELFGPILGGITKFVSSAATGIGQVAQTVQLLRSGLLESSTKAGADARDQFSKLGATAVSIGRGVVKAIDRIVSGVDALRERLGAAGSMIKTYFGGAGLERLAELGTIFLVVAGAVAPVLGAVAGLGLVLTGVVIPAVTGLWSILAAVAGVLTGPVGLALAAVVGGMLLFRREGESAWDTIRRLGTDAITWIRQIWTTAISPLIMGIKQGFMPALGDLGVAWASIMDSIRFAITEVGAALGLTAEQGKTDWLETGRTIGAALGAVASTLATVISWVVRLGVLAFSTALRIDKAFRGFVIDTILRIVSTTKKAYDGFTDLFSGNLLQGLRKLGKALLDYMLTPLRTITLAAIRLADAVNIPVPNALRAFAENGIPDSILPQVEDGGGPARAATAATAASATTGAELAGPPEVNVAGPTVNVPAPKVEVKSALQVDGREIAYTVSKNQTEITERAGFKATPWQRRLAVEHAAVM